MTDIEWSSRVAAAVVFLKLSPSRQRDLAERFALDLQTTTGEQNFERAKRWLIEAKTKGCLSDLLAETVPADKVTDIEATLRRRLDQI